MTPPETAQPQTPPLPRHQRHTGLKEFLFGTAYYPEHWSEADRQDDAQRMADAGVNTVRMAEFAWDLMEPSRGEYEFSFFDKTIELLARHGIRTILCTPTAAPPRWLTRNHPEWMRIDSNGRSMTHGSRQHCCTNHPGFQKESIRITRTMARHFQENSHVVGWQTDNEFFCHFSECHCPACLSAFRVWLQKEYRTISLLNEAWGTSFWAQTYDSFEDILFPLPDRPTHANPGQQLDYYRFLSQAITSFQGRQITELRKANPRWWISHNGTFDHINHRAFSEGLDFYGVDVYPGFSARPDNNYQIDPVWAALKLEECRAAAGNFVVFEQQSGAGGQRPYILPTPRPGQMRLWAWQAVAHGADGVLHFRWRTCRFGAEMYWHGILDHDNIPRRRFQEFSQEGEEFRRIGARIIGTVPLIKAAVLTQFDQDEAHHTMPLGLPAPWQQRKHLLRELQARHLPCGAVDASDSFEGLDIIFLAGFSLMDESLAKRLESFVIKGGTLVTSARCATRDRDNRVLPVTAPGWLTTTFGLTVEEFGAHDELALKLKKKSIPANSVYEVLQPFKNAEVISRWGPPSRRAIHSSYGSPAIVTNRAGKGNAIYIGTLFGEENTPALLDLILAGSSLKSLGKASPDVLITCRRHERCTLVFLLNHSGESRTVRNLAAGLELISAKSILHQHTLAPYQVAVIELTKP